MRLTLLCTNDTHSKHETPKDDEPGGLARRASYLKMHRAQATAEHAVAHLDCGDSFMGSDYFTFFNGEVEMKVLEHLACAGACVGNHEFDGEPSTGTWKNLITQQRKHAPTVALLAANLRPTPAECTREPSYQDAFVDYILLDGDGQRVLGEVTRATQRPIVAVVGLLGVTAWHAIPQDRRKGMDFEDPMVAASRVKALLQDLPAGAPDATFCLSHSGVTRGDRELAALGVFDCIQSGHEHMEDLKAPAELIKADTTLGGCYLHQGVWAGAAMLRWDLDFNADHTLVKVGCAVDPLSCDLIEDPDSLQLLRGYATEFEATTSQVLTMCARSDLTYGITYESRAEVGQLLADLLLAEVPSTSEGIVETISIIHQGGIRSAFSEGEVTWGTMNKVWPWNLPPSTCDLTLENLRKLYKESEESSRTLLMKHALHWSSNVRSLLSKTELADTAVIRCVTPLYTVDMVIAPVLGRQCLTEGPKVQVGLRDALIESAKKLPQLFQ